MREEGPIAPDSSDNSHNTKITEVRIEESGILKMGMCSMIAF